jgi:phospholipid-binding lipoprotein MlaA
MPVDYYFISAWPYIDNEHSLRTGLAALYLIDTRADLLPADKLVDKAFDPYIFVREAYLQKREGLISHQNQQRQQHDLENEALDLDGASTE